MASFIWIEHLPMVFSITCAAFEHFSSFLELNFFGTELCSFYSQPQKYLRVTPPIWWCHQQVISLYYLPEHYFKGKFLLNGALKGCLPMLYVRMSGEQCGQVPPFKSSIKTVLPSSAHLKAKQAEQLGATTTWEHYLNGAFKQHPHCSL